MKLSRYIKAAFFIACCELVGVLGSLFTISSIQGWYSTLIKPSFNPPNWIFGPVWVILYTLMGVSAFLIWEKGVTKKNVRSAIKIFGVQLFLNGIWTPIFFGAKNLFLALIVIVLLWFLVLKTILAFNKIDKTSSYLLVPYLFWVSFASVLNFLILALNK